MNTHELQDCTIRFMTLATRYHLPINEFNVSWSRDLHGVPLNFKGAVYIDGGLIVRADSDEQTVSVWIDDADPSRKHSNIFYAPIKDIDRAMCDVVREVLQIIASTK